ncbi:MAG: alpha/beta hydrolase fold domain-containing protein [Paracoccaceae bacterium]
MSKLPDPALLEIAARFSHGPVEQTRENMDEVRALARAARSKLVGRHADAVTNTLVGNLRRFVPKANMDRSKIIVFVHGGGWINCDTVTHGAIMSDLAYLSGHEVLGPEYPLAPENPYPVGLNAVCDLVGELVASRPNVRIILAGDSAGANLALAAALRLRDEGRGGSLAALLLWYGCYRPLFDTESHVAYGGGAHGLSSDSMRQCWDWYLGDHATPVYGDLTEADMAGLPPCYLGEAELDCLADDTKWLAGLLTRAGVRHSYEQCPGVNHGFVHFGQFYAPSFDALKSAAHFLKTPRMLR